MYKIVLNEGAAMSILLADGLYGHFDVKALSGDNLPRSPRIGLLIMAKKDLFNQVRKTLRIERYQAVNWSIEKNGLTLATYA